MSAHIDSDAGDRVCASCRWWRELDQCGTRVGTGPTPGQCRKHAPGIDLAGQRPRTVWPLTRPTDWCGKWQRIGGAEPDQDAPGAEDVEGKAP